MKLPADVTPFHMIQWLQIAEAAAKRAQQNKAHQRSNEIMTFWKSEEKLIRAVITALQSIDERTPIEQFIVSKKN